MAEQADLPVVGHDEHAEKAVDDGERHNQRVETVAQLLPSKEEKKCIKKETLSEKYLISFQIKRVLCWQSSGQCEEDWIPSKLRRPKKERV